MLTRPKKKKRPERKENDKLAAIRKIWDKFVANCASLYTPYEYCTVDEQLLGFRGRCPFRVYMVSKPDKYGIKIVMLNDAKTFYLLNATPYTGKLNTNNESVPSFYVRTPTEPIHGTYRNITVDNWFSSVDLFQNMLTQHGLTMIGTLRKNKREVPPSFLLAKNVGCAKFAFDANKTLVSYVPRRNKVVLLLSSMHYDDIIDKETGKPEIIMTYNSTKGGTDTFDQLCHSYSTARKTNRWPMRFWFGMLDQSAINAKVLYSLNLANTKSSRRSFLKELAYSLIEPMLKKRL